MAARSLRVSAAWLPLVCVAAKASTAFLTRSAIAGAGVCGATVAAGTCGLIGAGGSGPSVFAGISAGGMGAAAPGLSVVAGISPGAGGVETSGGAEAGGSALSVDAVAGLGGGFFAGGAEVAPFGARGPVLCAVAGLRGGAGVFAEAGVPASGSPVDVTPGSSEGRESGGGETVGVSPCAAVGSAADVAPCGLGAGACGAFVGGADPDAAFAGISMAGFTYSSVTAAPDWSGLLDQVTLFAGDAAVPAWPWFTSCAIAAAVETTERATISAETGDINRKALRRSMPVPGTGFEAFGSPINFAGQPDLSLDENRAAFARQSRRACRGTSRCVMSAHVAHRPHDLGCI